MIPHPTSKVVNKSLHAAATRGSKRPDLAMLQEVDSVNLHNAAQSLHAHRARPSLLHPLLRALGATLGTAAVVAPPLQATIHAAVSDALSELYDEQLRDLHQQGLVRVYRQRNEVSMIRTGIGAPRRAEAAQAAAGQVATAPSWCRTGTRRCAAGAGWWTVVSDTPGRRCGCGQGCGGWGAASWEQDLTSIGWRTKTASRGPSTPLITIDQPAIALQLVPHWRCFAG